MLLVTQCSLLYSQKAYWNNKGAKIYVGPQGYVNVKGEMNHDSASIIHTYGTLRANTIKNYGLIDLKGDSSLLIIDSSLLLESGKVMLNNRTLIINNRDTSAIQVADGRLVADDSVGGNVQWHIGEYTGRYIVPFVNDSLQDISMELNVTEPGYGLEGYIDFHSYSTNNENEPLPFDPGSDAARMLLETPLQITDRYWRVSPVNYAQAPFAEINVRYAPSDSSGSNTIVHDSLILSRWNNNCWTRLPGAIDLQSRAYKTATVSQYGLLVLHDKRIPLLCNDGHSCDYALFYEGGNNGNMLYDMSDSIFWLRFIAEEDGSNLFRVSKNDTHALNLKKIEIYEQCSETTALHTVTIGNSTPMKYFEVNGLTQGAIHYLKFYKKTPGASIFKLDSPDLRLFANVAEECNDSAGPQEVCLWYSDYSDVYPRETQNKYVWKVYTADSHQLVFVDTTETSASRLNGVSLDFGDYYYRLEEQDAKKLPVYIWDMSGFQGNLISLYDNPDVTYSDLYDDETFDNEIDLQKPVGAIAGMFGTTPTGAATYTIPIPVPPGTNGMAPDIALSYNSQSGNGIMGMGWDISGLSVISRISKDWYHDPDNVSAINLNSNDRFALDGNRLVKMYADEVYGAAGTRYATEMETFSVITSHEQFPNGSNDPEPKWFEVFTKGGLRMEFGRTPDSRFLSEDKRHVIFWRMNKIKDQYGNYIEFIYVNDKRDSRIAEIRYTGNDAESLAPYNKIKFDYILSRTDENTSYIAGSGISSKYLLNRIIITGEQENIIKTFRLAYGKDDSHSYLKDITEFGGDDMFSFSLNATKFKYGNQPDEYLAYDEILTIGGDADVFTGDFNGDGFTDLIVANKEWDDQIDDFVHISYKLYYKEPNPTSNDFVGGPGGNFPSGFTIFEHTRNFPNTNLFILSDYNGDGKDDLLIAERWQDQYDLNERLSRIKIHLSGSWSDTISIPHPVIANDHYDHIELHGKFLYTGDFDGDGRQDFITLLAKSLSNPANLYTKAFVSFPGRGEFNLELSFDVNNPYSAGPILNEKSIHVLDFDGDGKNELMVLRNDGKSYDIYAIKKASSNKYLAQKIVSSGFASEAKHISFGDFNGDGKTDILAKTTDWTIGYSDGKAFQMKNFTFCSSPTFNYPSVILQDKLSIADVNGDGMSDIIHGNVSACCGAPAQYSLRTIYVYYSMGNSFVSSNFSSGTDYSNDNYPLVVGDYNGDGKDDVIIRREHYSPNETFCDIIYFNPLGTEQLLEKVADGLGRVVEFAYKPLTAGQNGNPDFHVQGALSPNAYPVNSFQSGIYAVSSVTTDNGIGGTAVTEFLYEDARIQRQGLGFMGFKKLIAKNLTANLKTITEFEFRQPYYFPAVIEVKSFLSDDTPLTTATYLNEIAAISGNSLSGGARFHPLMRHTREINHLSGSEAIGWFDYDLSGNTIYSHRTINGAETVTTRTTFVAAATPYPAKPLNINVTKTRVGQAPYSMRTVLSYDPKGAVASKIDFWGTPCQTSSVYTYDDFGNLESETVQGERTNSIVYESKGRFPERVYNNIGQFMEYEYNSDWGAPLSVTGIDGNTTGYEYDEWGRLTETAMPEGYSITTTYGWDVQESPPSVYYVLTQHPGLPDVKVWYDLLGRETGRQTEGFDSEWLEQITGYDERGNIASKTNTYYSGETPIAAIYHYDDYNRLVSVESSESQLGAVEYAYAYHGGNATVTVTNPAGQVSTATTDATGKVIASTDDGGSLNFEYYSSGNQKRVRIGSVQLAYFEFDDCGRQTLLKDKNAGDTRYEYNAFGELIRQTDANGITRTGTGEGTTAYTYVESGNGVNQIDVISGFSGFTQNVDYNGYGRAVAVIETIGSETLTTEYEYDDYGNVTAVAYPDGFGIKRQYANGYLTAIKNSSETVTMFSNPSYNGFGQCTGYTLGNGLSSSIEHEFGFPKHFHTSGIQDLHMGYDYASGNVTYRRDDLKGRMESFSYDNLNRLTRSVLALYASPLYLPVDTLDIAYSPLGNIAYKTDAGAYSYLTPKISAVTKISANSGSISPLTQNITYTPFHQPASVTEGDFELTYAYGPDYQRKKMELKENSSTVRTRIYHGEYEKDVDGSTERHIHYINSPAGLVCMVVKEGTDEEEYFYTYTDHLGSILTVTDDEGTVVAEQNFDAWGRNRNASDWTYDNIASVPSWLYRGFTGHEHVPHFALINMNGRMYDPVLGRMLSVDNYVQAPLSSQGYNRYSYVMNNPLNYVDPSGEYGYWHRGRYIQVPTEPGAGYNAGGGLGGYAWGSSSDAFLQSLWDMSGDATTWINANGAWIGMNWIYSDGKWLQPDWGAFKQKFENYIAGRDWVYNGFDYSFNHNAYYMDFGTGFTHIVSMRIPMMEAGPFKNYSVSSVEYFDKNMLSHVLEYSDMSVSATGLIADASALYLGTYAPKQISYTGFNGMAKNISAKTVQGAFEITGHTTLVIGSSIDVVKVINGDKSLEKAIIDNAVYYGAAFIGGGPGLTIGVGYLIIDQIPPLGKPVLLGPPRVSPTYGINDATRVGAY